MNGSVSDEVELRAQVKGESQLYNARNGIHKQEASNGDTAFFGGGGVYRYYLTRRISGNGTGACCFVMLNPSTADAFANDPTVGRCMQFAKLWEFARLVVVNLYAYRSPDPSKLLTAVDPVGQRNDEYIRAAVYESDLTVCAWGNHATPTRINAIFEIFGTEHVRVYCLGITKNHRPLHPLARGKSYVPYTRRLREYTASGHEGAYWKGRQYNQGQL